MTDRYYIAYGSNLSIAQMKVRTPDAKIVGTGILKGWRLLFRQYATIERKSKYNTPVLIWKISAQDEKNLDRYEGFPSFYVKKNLKVAVTSINGEDLGKLTAMVYVMTPEAVNLRSSSSRPSKDYFLILEEGYKHFGFNTATLDDALKEAWQNEVSCASARRIAKL